MAHSNAEVVVAMDVDTDINDVMYENIDADLSSMAAKHKAELDAKAAKQADKDAKKAEEAKQKEVAEAQRLKELLSAPLPEVSGNAGPGSNAATETLTLVNKQARKRKEREAMTQEERDAEDEEKARRVQKGKETKARNKARKEREEREANEPPKKQQRSVREVKDALDAAFGALDRARREAMDKCADLLPVSLQKLTEDVTELQEELRLTEAEVQRQALASGRGMVAGLGENGRWMPEGVWLNADLKSEKEGRVRDVNALFKREVDRLKETGQAGTEVYACVYKTWKELGAELKRRLHNTNEFIKAAKEEARQNAISERQQRAIDDFDNWEKILVSASDRVWWHNYGFARAMNKHYPNANVCKPAEVDAMAPLIEAQVETEEM